MPQGRPGGRDLVALRTITVARKPLSESSVAKNVLKHGTAGLNIDASRIGSSTRTNSSKPKAKRTGFIKGFVGGTETEIHNHGRWPANLILMHKPECERTGTRQEPGYVINRWVDGAKPFGGGAGHPYESEEQKPETVDVWVCAEGCPVAELDEQSGDRPRSGGTTTSPSPNGSGWGMQHQGQMYADKGGASRYFKQVRDRYDLDEYLITLISPPEDYGRAFIISDLATADWKSIAATWHSMQGIAAQGTPTAEQAAELLRVLRPGAHLMLIAPDEQPTGHTGACRLEDEGFEIRDAILLVEEPGGIHYVPKAARKERELGCEHLQSKKGHEAVERKEGSAGVNNPRAGAGRTASQVRNFHPTVKPIGIMEALLADVPEDADVCDPFTGSGTTGIAAVNTGHSFIGIEREEEYLIIADARIRYWADKANYDLPLIESDAPEAEEQERELSPIEALFKL